MTEIVPYQAGMTLGRTFDLSTHRQGLDIFSKRALKETKIIERHQNNQQYAVIQRSRDVNNLLDVSGEISLKLKAGVLNMEGFGSYLKEDRSQENTLEIVARAHVETFTETMTSTAVKRHWKKRVMGTHYIRSITYGGDLVARIKIEGSNPTEFEEIKAKVIADLRDGGVINASAKANFRKLEENIKSSSQITITYHATSLEGQMPRDISGMLKTLDEFKTNIMKLNEGKGVPCTCELVPLNALDERLPQVLRDKSVDVKLAEFEDCFDDVLHANNRFNRVLQREDLELTDDQEDKAAELETRMEEVLAEIHTVISKLDVTSNGNGVAQLKPAFEMYKARKKTGGFQREVSKFIKSVKFEQAKATPLQDLPPGQPLHLVLIGKTGHGKSATANSIFGENRFVSRLSSSSVTSKCQYEIGIIGGREICLVDTPGTRDTHKPTEMLKEVGTAIAYRPDGYHAFLLVLNVDVRMTAEEQMAVTMFKKMFGEDVLMKFAVLVFTHGDSFYSYQKKSRTTVSFNDYILTQGGELSKLVEECGRRCALMNNMEDDPGKLRDQVIELVNVVDNLVDENDGSRYTNQYFELAKEELAKEEDAARVAKKRQRNTINDKIKAARKKEKVGSRVADQVEKDGNSCFPADAHVILESGKRIKIKDVVVGDKILSAVENYKFEFSEVYIIVHRDASAVTDFITISTGEASVTMTPDHHVFVVVDGIKQTVPARKVEAGNHILVCNEETTLTAQVVTEITGATGTGIYCPLTMAGTIVVNDVLASCYVDCVPPKVAHPLMSPVRQIHKWVPSLSKWVNDPTKTGMPSWVNCSMKYILVPHKQ